MKKLDLRDAHVYGGAAMVALGLGLWHFSLGLVAMGSILVYLGLRSA
jgi:hypothetical protein